MSGTSGLKAMGLGMVLAGGVLVLLGGASNGRAAEDVVFLGDVRAQFAALSLRPDGLGFSIGSSPDPSQCKHYQGIVRINGPDGTPYMFVSRSGIHTGGCPTAGDDHANLLVVKMGSRDTNGERLRSNRYVPFLPMDSTPPDPRDTVVKTITFNGTYWPNYGHAGGMQAIGDILVVPMEAPYDSSLPSSVFLFLDVSNPEDPHCESWWAPPDPSDSFSAGVVGIAPFRVPTTQGWRYVMVAAGKDNTSLRFYRSLPTEPDGSTDLHSPSLSWEEAGRYSEEQIEDCIPTDWHTGSGDAHQTLSLVREGGVDGPLYMIGARNTTKLPSGDDYLDLYQVHITSTGYPLTCVLEFIDTTHFTSYPYMNGGDSANFGAASGVYVSPSGELIVYSTEYENDGPVQWGGGAQTVRFGEYRHRNMVRPNSPTLRPTLDVATEWEVDEGSAIPLSATGKPAITKAWIQLYEDDDAGDSFPGSGNQWIAVDFDDRNADDFADFSNLNFAEQAGSWRWFAPYGCTIGCNDNAVAGGGDPGPDTVYLTGGCDHANPEDSCVAVEPDLNSIGFDDDMGSVSFLGNCVAYYDVSIHVAWDLDNNGTFETSGNPTTFDAALLDGPSDVPIAARAQHPFDTTFLGSGDPVPITVKINNVPPAIDTLYVTDSTGNQLNTDVPIALVGLPVTVWATFTDPGVPDTHTATAHWDDGSMDTSFDSFSDCTGGVTGSLNDDHTYSAPDSYTVVVAVTDDDGGVVIEDVTIQVVSIEEAIETVAELLETELAGVTDPTVAAALQRAIDFLVGNIDSQADNGALDALDAEEAGDAISHLITSIEAIEAAEAADGLDLSAIKDLLGLCAEALAVSALNEADMALNPPSKGEAKQLATIESVIEEGHQLLLGGNYVDACWQFQWAATRAGRLISK